MRSESELREFFRRELLPELRGYERRRKSALARVWNRATAIVLVTSIVFSFAIGNPLPLVLAVAWFIYRFTQVVTSLQHDLKENLVSRVLRFWNPDLEYVPNGSIGEDEFRASHLYSSTWNRYRGEDLVRGRSGATDFRFCELRVTRKEQKRSEGTVFSGLFFVADFHKSFRGRTFVLPDVAERTFGSLGRALQGLQSVDGADLVTLENVEFEKYFRVYATDPVEARYLLTPSLMERIVRLRKNGASEIRIAFARQKLHLAMPLSHDLFALDPTKSAISEEGMRTWIGELELAIGLVEELDLNTRIWSKGAPPLARTA